MLRSEKNSTEEIVITYFVTHGETDVEAKTMKCVIPINTGRFALSSMIKGFAENFVRYIDPETATKMVSESELDCQGFKTMVNNALASKEA